MINPKVTIIIPLYVISERFFRDLKYFSKLEYENFEIIVVSDVSVRLPKLRGVSIRLLITGKKITGPAEKRDMAIKKASGEICAFIDDDAYPHRKWLKKAVRWFYIDDILAVGGPGVTPKNEKYWGMLGGMVYESVLTSGLAQERFISKGKKIKQVDDWPAYNLIVRKKVLISVGGYGVSYYGGEDTFLCLKIIRKGMIIYDPEVIVYHHRRSLFLPHMRQILNIGIHRGYFAKVYPKTSRKLFYFIPSVLTISFVLFFALVFLSDMALYIFFPLLSLFLIIGILSVIRKSNLVNSILISLGIIITHLIYGIGFLKGFLTRNLKR